MTVRITLEQCITLYRARIDAGPLVNRGKLDGAVAAPFQTFDDQDLFPTLIGKAARLAYGGLFMGVSETANHLVRTQSPAAVHKPHGVLATHGVLETRNTLAGWRLMSWHG